LERLAGASASGRLVAAAEQLARVERERSCGERVGDAPLPVTTEPLQGERERHGLERGALGWGELEQVAGVQLQGVRGASLANVLEQARPRLGSGEALAQRICEGAHA